MLLENIKLW